MTTNEYSDRAPFWNVEWQLEAACRGCDPDIWFPTRGKDVHEGKTICATCPVLVECRDWADFYAERRGIWGGLTWNERRRVKRGIAERECPDCGMNHVPKNAAETLCHWCQRWQPKMPQKAL